MTASLSDMAGALVRLPGPSPLDGWHWEAKVWRDPDVTGGTVTFHATWRLVPTVVIDEALEEER